MLLLMMLLLMRQQPNLTERLLRVLQKLMLMMRPLLERHWRLLLRSTETAPRCKRSWRFGLFRRPE